MKKDRSPRSPRRERRTAGRAQDPDVGDPYLARHKPSGSSVCSECGAVFEEGRWSWGERPPKARETICPACHRIRDRYPAGLLTLSGPFARAHKEEILRLARHNEEQEKREHPLNRIMEIEEKDDAIVVSTTDIHLPRRIGRAISGAYDGDLAIHFDEDGYFIRVDWTSKD
ncbi:MAG TPA: BCAM0308 family protein [Vicinamibacteria bacterium]|nr:BCAM0308 family protein [Vicinamibacteria bacterium]